MGLGDFKEDSGDDEQKSERDYGGGGGGGGKRKYVRITEEEFEDFLDKLWYEWHEANPSDDGFRKFSKEKVYSIPPLNGNISDDVTILIFSTIDTRTGKARDKGQDAIRCVLWDTELQKPIGGRKKTLRIESWRSNLGPKVENLVEETNEYLRHCPECQTGWLVKREGQYGEFLGCVRYPDCNHTEQIDE
jgi:hypothetical protein